MPTFDSRLVWIIGLLVLLQVALVRVKGSVTNVTLDDSSPSFTFQPAGAWSANSTACPSGLNCLDTANLTFAYNGSWHVTPVEGVPQLSPSSTAAPASSSTSSSESSVTSSPSTPTGSTSTSPAATSSSDGTHDPGHDGDHDGDDGGGSKRSLGRTTRTIPLVPRAAPTTIQINFTGTALYLFSIDSSFAGTSLKQAGVNVTFTMDSAAAGSFQRDDSPQPAEFNVLSFAQTGLANGPHVFEASVAPNSIFMVDYAIITQDDQTTANVPGAARTATAPSNTASSPSKKSVASFGAAVGGTAGVLAVMAFSLFISIYSRRIRSARRERRERLERASRQGSESGSFHTFSDGGSMREREAGPVAFVPRFFPGMTPATPPAYASLPPAPPTFEESMASAGMAAPGLAQPILPDILDADLGPPPDSPPPPPPELEIAPLPVSHTMPSPPVPTRRMSVTDVHTHTLVPGQTQSETLQVPPPSFAESTSSAGAAPSLPQPRSAMRSSVFEALDIDDDALRGAPRGREEIRTIVRSRTPSPSPTDSLMVSHYTDEQE